MKPITEQRCAFCQYKCGREGSYKLEICGEDWFYCSEECKDEIVERLFAYAWPKIMKGITRGLPEWYKTQIDSNKLAKQRTYRDRTGGTI